MFLRSFLLVSLSILFLLFSATQSRADGVVFGGFTVTSGTAQRTSFVPTGMGLNLFDPNKRALIDNLRKEGEVDGRSTQYFQTNC